MNTDLRAEIAEILGLETSPDGEPFYLLTRDEDDTILEGVDYSKEIEQLAALVEGALRMHQGRFDRANRLDQTLATIREACEAVPTIVARKVLRIMDAR